MAEKIYMIPVNDAFDAQSECPVCSMYRKLEDDAVDFMIGSGASYMVDDIRLATDEIGFCKPHMKILAVQKNRLGLALILKTHLDKQKKNAENVYKKGIRPRSFLQKQEEAPVVAWAKKASSSCYICDRINVMFPRYIDTIFYLYKKDPAFRDKYAHCKGFCQEHLGVLLEKAQKEFGKQELQAFTDLTVKLYTDNLQRLSDDLDWFVMKFDYLHRNDPWKESKDAIERAAVKTNGVMPPAEKTS